MPRYVDGYVVPVPRRKLDAYRKLARMAGRIYRDLGALEYVECVADDVKPGKWTSFPRSVKLKKGETVIFAYVVFRSRAHRDRVNKKAMQHPRLTSIDPATVPFDPKRFFWGGFRAFVTF